MVSKVMLLCDRCYVDDIEMVGVEKALGVDGAWKVVHLCDKCQDELNEGPHSQALTFFLDHGETRDAGNLMNINLDEYPCLWCPKTFTTTSGLDQHLKGPHGFSSPEAAWGYTCPECGQEFQRLAMHSSRSHAVHVSILMQKAASAGDPFKVIRDRLRAAKKAG
jgi:DNA-directed RNA polymerase subunit RPC12/RpoP